LSSFRWAPASRNLQDESEKEITKKRSLDSEQSYCMLQPIHAKRKPGHIIDKAKSTTPPNISCEKEQYTCIQKIDKGNRRKSTNLCYRDSRKTLQNSHSLKQRPANFRASNFPPVGISKGVIPKLEEVVRSS
jgi:hypothetical protein